MDTLSSIAEEIHDPDEESFFIFSSPIPTSNLGFIDSHAPFLDISIHDNDYSIIQSQGLLSSKREGGTTGAVLWKITPLLSTWLSSASNPLRTNFLSPSSAVVELGCGISSLLALSLGPLVGKYIATDQEYVKRLFRENLLGNLSTAYKNPNKKGKAQRKGKTGSSSPSPSPSPSRAAARATESSSEIKAENIAFTQLDWELNDALALNECVDDRNGFDMLVSCDCIYNEALAAPFVRTCADICRLRSRSAEREGRPTVCVIAQQLRMPDVFETWLREAMKEFRVWRVFDEVLGDDLKLGTGYVVHLLMLKEESMR
ncbi:hypothetical protein PHISCL_07831 [Aspergillus sclerotialis]|uniref:Diaminohydroxyphosphoribosylamino-pyrimidine deaminase n=1 Tax=Aspergillus sclerotialis TaxID=2070753 RepID=A0A3A2Z9N9_9EURO|nr:hypothetical protein PHISCL_07831 [Aspergillus sclerotialis]